MQQMSEMKPPYNFMSDKADREYVHDSIKVLKGLETQYSSDKKAIVDSVQYDIPRHDIDPRSTLTIHVDPPKVPRLYFESFYGEIVKIRLENGDDISLANEIEEFLYYERQVPDVIFGHMVYLLLTAYPLLEAKHSTLFDSFRRAAVIYQEREPSKFRRCFASHCGFLCDNWSPTQLPLQEPMTASYVEIQDPIIALDILYTLRVWNCRPPFNAIVFSEYALKKAEHILENFDIVEYRQRLEVIPDYLEAYVKRVTSSRKSIISRMLDCLKR